MNNILDEKTLIVTKHFSSKKTKQNKKEQNSFYINGPVNDVISPKVTNLFLIEKKTW